MRGPERPGEEDSDVGARGQAKPQDETRLQHQATKCWPLGRSFALPARLEKVCCHATVVALVFVATLINQGQFMLAAPDYHTNSGNGGGGTNFQLYSSTGNEITTDGQPKQVLSSGPSAAATAATAPGAQVQGNQIAQLEQTPLSGACVDGLLTFELSTGFIYKPASAETLAMMPSTLQLTDCLDYCLHNATCLAINFEMGLCVLLSSSAKQNPSNLYSSQFPVFTIYAEKKCLLSGDPQVGKQRRRCQRAWTFERVAGYEMKTRPRRRLRLANKELCMEACLLEREFECRSANWYRQSGECTLSEQDRHSVSQSEAGDQQVKASLHQLYGPTNLTGPPRHTRPPALPSGLYQNYYSGLQERSHNDDGLLELKPDQARVINNNPPSQELAATEEPAHRGGRQLASPGERMARQTGSGDTGIPTSGATTSGGTTSGGTWPNQYVDMPANALVDYLENNCVYEPNKLCEFRKIQNRVLKTVDSIYQDVASLDECKQKCLNAPYRCYSFDYGDTSERVCRTSHLDQASLLSVKEPYLDVVGAITYELASCFNVSIQCRAREMVAQVSASKMFKGKIYVKSRPTSCVNDIKESLQFELTMRYHDEACDVRSSSSSQLGVFSNELIIQHHDRIVTTQDVGLSVYCQYYLGNKSITNNVDLAIERFDEPLPLESKTQPGGSGSAQGVGRPGSGAGANGPGDPSSSSSSGGTGSLHSPLTITSLATTVVRSPNVTMRITNMNGQPVTSATVGDRLALLFEVKEKTSPFGIFVREIIAMDGRGSQMAPPNVSTKQPTANNANSPAYHYAATANNETAAATGADLGGGGSADPLIASNSIQFIDSQGCPTDANIMGPLVRMDAAGHRVLAPFDAFKFPTSDMVFFRAVVTSCIAECRPALCPQSGAGSDSSNFDSFGSNDDTPQPGTPTIMTDLSLLLGSTTRTMPNRSAGDQMQTSASRTVLTTGSTIRPPTTPQVASTRSPDLMPSTLAPGGRWPPSTQAASSESVWETLDNKANRTKLQLASTSGDSLTTVPGFFGPSGPQKQPSGSNNNQQAAADQWSHQQATQAAQAAELLLAASRLQQLNMTNNHQLGAKAPERPSLPVAKLPPLDLDRLSASEKQQMIELFEARLKQQQHHPAVAHLAGAPMQITSVMNNESSVSHGSGSSNNNSASGNNNLADMADFYTGFLTSVMLNGIPLDRNGADNEGLRAAGEPGSLEQKRYEKVDQTLSSTTSSSTTTPAPNVRQQAAELESLLAPYLAGAQQVAPLNSSDERTLDGLRALLASLQVALGGQRAHSAQTLSPPPSPQENPKPQTDSKQAAGNYLLERAGSQQAHNDLATDATNLASSLQARQGQQTFDRSQTAAASSGGSLNRIKIRSQQQQQQQQQLKQPHAQVEGGNKTSIAKLAAITKVGQEAAAPLRAGNKRKRDKASQLQAFADSYQGAYQSFGRKRRRRRHTASYASRGGVEMSTSEARACEHDDELTQDSQRPPYVYLGGGNVEQANVAPSSGGERSEHEQLQSIAEENFLPVGEFAGAFVELYHTSAPGVRTKREAQPYYDMEELVVQSIKIVDRLHFPDEEQQADGAAQSRQKLNRALDSGARDNQRARQQSPYRSHTARTNLTLAPGYQQTKHPAPGYTGERAEQATQSGDEYENHSFMSWTQSTGVMSLVVVALSFVFVQIFLVLLCLVDWNWNRSRRINQRSARSVAQVSGAGGQRKRCTSLAAVRGGRSQAVRWPGDACSTLDTSSSGISGSLSRCSSVSTLCSGATLCHAAAVPMQSTTTSSGEHHLLASPSYSISNHQHYTNSATEVKSSSQAASVEAARRHRSRQNSSSNERADERSGARFGRQERRTTTTSGGDEVDYYYYYNQSSRPTRQGQLAGCYQFEGASSSGRAVRFYAAGRAGRSMDEAIEEAQLKR